MTACRGLLSLQPAPLLNLVVRRRGSEEPYLAEQGTQTMMRRHRNAYFATLTLVLGVGTTVSAQPKTKPLPEGAEKKTVTIYSDGTKMIGDLYLPPGLQKADK